jgi:RNA-directed DNA polymerase
MATNLQLIRKRVKITESIRTIHDLSKMVGMDELRLHTLAHRPHYNEFSIPKKIGFRLIEDPEDDLKHVQDKLNELLQAIYYYNRPAAVYGFCISSQNEEERNIITNAKRHLKCTYLLNIDLKDFFHQVTENKVMAIINQYLPYAEEPLTQMLTKLCIYKSRLPGIAAIDGPSVAFIAK